MAEETIQQEPKVDVEALRASIDAAHRTKAPQQPKEPEPPKQETVKQEPPKQEQKQDDGPGGIKELRTEFKARGEKLRTLEQQLSEFEGTKKERDELKARIEELEKKQESYKKIESVAALEQSEEFQNKYIKGREQHVTRLKELAELADVPESELMQAVSKKGKDRIAALDDLLGAASRFVSDDIVQEIKAMDRLDSERASELAHANETMEERRRDRENESRRRRDEQARLRTEAWQNTETRLSDELGLSRDQKEAAAKFYRENKDATKAAEITLKGHAYDALQAKLKEAQEELARYRTSEPGLRAGVREAEVDPDRNLSISERINKQLHQRGY